MQVHLVLVYLALVKNLIDQEQKSLGIAVYHVDILFALCVF